MAKRRTSAAIRPAVLVPDSIDEVVAGWADQAPGLPVQPIEVVARIGKLRSRFDEELAGLFARYDLTAADFTVIAALRRAGPPYQLSQSTLMNRIGLTSGTVSVRLARLAHKGVVARGPHPDDARGALVTLTAHGLELFGQVAPDHLHNEDVLLSALTSGERDQLAGLLRKLLHGFENESSVSPWGMELAPAHLARRVRASAGLPDTPGLLVVGIAPGGPAALAGVRTGDLLVTADGIPLLSCITLAELTVSSSSASRPLALVLVRGTRKMSVPLMPTGATA